MLFSWCLALSDYLLLGLLVQAVRCIGPGLQLANVWNKLSTYCQKTAVTFVVEHSKLTKQWTLHPRSQRA